jgi:DNA-binding response OmpR family regulator
MDMTGVKILILSAAVDEFHREEAIVAGANDFLPKPFRPEELLGKLRVWLAPEKNGETSAPASAPALGADWTAAIKRALTEADLEKISALLETLGQTDPAHAAEFSKMAERFDFDAIRRGLDAL